MNDALPGMKMPSIGLSELPASVGFPVLAPLKLPKSRWQLTTVQDHRTRTQMRVALHMTFASLILCATILVTSAQNPPLPVARTTPSFEHPPLVKLEDSQDFSNDPCGDPRRESTGWVPVRGRVSKVLEGDALVLSISRKNHVLIHLVGIDAPPLDNLLGTEARQFLSDYLLGKSVEVWVNPSNWVFKRPRSAVVTGVVYLLSNGQEDVNLSLLRAGLARYKLPEPYSMSSYTQCKYDFTEQEAHAAKRGLWRGGF